MVGKEKGREGWIERGEERKGKERKGRGGEGGKESIPDSERLRGPCRLVMLQAYTVRLC